MPSATKATRRSMRPQALSKSHTLTLVLDPACLTCREKCRKCDRARPACNRCVSKGLKCGGYPPRFQFLECTTSKMSSIASKGGQSSPEQTVAPREIGHCTPDSGNAESRSRLSSAAMLTPNSVLPEMPRSMDQETSSTNSRDDSFLLLSPDTASPVYRFTCVDEVLASDRAQDLLLYCTLFDKLSVCISVQTS